MLFFVPKFVKGFGAILQSPEIFESGIGTRHNVGSHDIRHDGEVQPAVTARHGHAHQPGFTHGIKVLLCAAGVGYSSVGYRGAFPINALGIRGNNFGADLADHLEHALVAVHRIVEVDRRIIVFVFISKFAFFQFHNPPHQRVMQVMTQRGGI